MTDRAEFPAKQASDPSRPTTDDRDALRAEPEPVKEHGDALRDGSSASRADGPPSTDAPRRD